MKKLVITLSIVLISLLGYSQVTNVGEFRVATATTDFGVNLPIGTKVYNIATGDYWVATAGVASTEDLTSAALSFTLLNNSGTDDQTASEVTIADAGGKYTATTVEAALAEIANTGYLTSEVDGSVTNEIQTIDTARLNGTTLELSLSSDGENKKEIDLSSLQDGTGTDDQGLTYNSGTHAIDIENGTNAIIPLAVDDGATEGLSSFTAADFTVTSGNVAIDYANGQAATNAQPGFATAAHITAIEANTAKATNVSTALSAGTISGTTYGITSDGGTDDIVLPEANTTQAGLLGADKWDEIVANTAKSTNVSTALSTGTVGASTYGITSDGGTDDVVIAAATSSASGVATASQITKLEGIATGAEVNLDLITEKFEEDDGTATAHTLSQTAVLAQGCRVSLNGATLDPAKYTFATGSITIGVPVYQYDQVVITYSY